VPDGIDAGVVRAHFEQVVDDVLEAGRRGFYQDVKETGRATEGYRPAPGAPALLVASLIFAQDGVDRASYVYLAGFRDCFLKIRFTRRIAAGEEGEKLHAAFMEALGRLLLSVPPTRTRTPQATEGG